MNQLAGFLVIDKPAGKTSHDLVAAVRRRLSIKQVGHAGTLDPMATGVLVIGVGNATKFLQHIVAGTKRYLATIQLGVSTSTDDREGEILETHDATVITDSQIHEALANFHGTIEQVPSSVSAIKVDGKRAYDRVRAGEEVKLAARSVTISELRVIAIRRDPALEIEIELTCSAGTYVRAIARDLGQALGVGGHLTALRRTLVAPFEIDVAEPVDSAPIIPLANALRTFLPIRVVSETEMRELRFGRAISATGSAGIVVALSASDEVVAIMEDNERGAAPMTVFNP